MGDEATKEKSSMSKSESFIDELNAILAKLKDKLNPILIEPTPTPEKASEERSTMVGRLSEFKDDLQGLLNRIDL